MTTTQATDLPMLDVCDDSAQSAPANFNFEAISMPEAPALKTEDSGDLVRNVHLELNYNHLIIA